MKSEGLPLDPVQAFNYILILSSHPSLPNDLQLQLFLSLYKYARFPASAAVK
jgi:hypothetical protein